jgi:hypothetical protein
LVNGVVDAGQGRFADVLGGRFYGLDVLLPYDFLKRERVAQRLSDKQDLKV